MLPPNNQEVSPMQLLSVTRSSIASIVAAAALFAGCASNPGDNASASEEATVASAVALPAPADPNARLYFGTPSGDYHSDATPLSYRVLTAKGGNEFKVSAAAMSDDGSSIDTTASVGFKLYRLAKVHGHSAWSLLQSVDGAQGVATLRYTSPVLRTYMIEVTAAPLPRLTSSSLSCAGGDDSKCAVARQPGESCGGLAASHFTCDHGLFCQYGDTQSCGAGDQQGSCQIAPQVCPLFFSPVCGCNGKTYGNSCQAHAAKTSITHAGPCNCDSSVWSAGFVSADVLAANTWQSVDQDYTFTFNTDGTFTSELAPACTRTVPRCMIAIQNRKGHFAIAHGVLTLSYDDAMFGATTFALETNCYRSQRIVGHDYGTDLALVATPKP
jgi:hypothetical protein